MAGVSLALHAAVLGYMALRTFDVPVSPPFSPVERLIPLDLTPRPLLRDETPRTPAQASISETSVAEASSPALAAPSLAASGAAIVRRQDDEDQTLSAPSARLAAPAPTGAPAGDAWRVRPESLGDAVARSLRQGIPGCRMLRGQMGAAQQAACDTAFNEAAARAAPIQGTGNPERDARFAAEGAREMRRYEMMRRPLSGGVGVVGPGDCPGSNFGMGCAGAHLPDVPGMDMRQGATTTHNPSQRAP